MPFLLSKSSFQKWVHQYFLFVSVCVCVCFMCLPKIMLKKDVMFWNISQSWLTIDDVKSWETVTLVWPYRLTSLQSPVLAQCCGRDLKRCPNVDHDSQHAFLNRKISCSKGEEEVVCVCPRYQKSSQILHTRSHHLHTTHTWGHAHSLTHSCTPTHTQFYLHSSM